jgi:hypothetical protein
VRDDLSARGQLEKPWGRSALLLVAAVLVAGLGSCQRAETRATFTERVAKYWELKQSKAWEEIYDGFVDPASKEAVPKEVFLKKRALAFDILTYEVGQLPEEADKVVVSVENEVNFPLRSPDGEMRLIKKRVTTTETWVHREGAWFVQVDK